MKVLTHLESVIQSVAKQIRASVDTSDPLFHDVYIQVVQKEGTVDLKEIDSRRKAFVAPVEANAEAGTPAGRRILAYVKTPMEQHTSVVGKKSKLGSKQSNLVVFNVFDSGLTKGSFKNILGAIEKNEMALIGDGLFELTDWGEFGRCVYPAYPPFYIYIDGKISIGKSKNAKGEWSTEQKRTARSRPMFLLASEMTGPEVRLDREVRRMHFVDDSQPIVVDDSETASAEAAEAGKAAVEAKLEPAAEAAQAVATP